MFKVLNKLGNSRVDAVSQKCVQSAIEESSFIVVPYYPKQSSKVFKDISDYDMFPLKQGDKFLFYTSYPADVSVGVTLIKDKQVSAYKEITGVVTNQLFVLENNADFDVNMLRVTINNVVAIDDTSKATIFVAGNNAIISQIHDKIVTNKEDTDAINDKIIEELKQKNLDLWSELQFGMFIHWGVYSVYGGSYTGTDINGNPISTNSEREWLMEHKLIPKADYMKKGAEFASDKWNPDLICSLAKSVGMKYIVLTLRHHEGFSLYPSQYCDWNISQSKASQDVVMQLKKACDRHGIKFGIYYSYFLNWTEVGGYGQSRWNGGKDPYTAEQHKAFVGKQISYINELIDVFHPAIIWYDNGTAGASEEMQQLFYNNQKDNYPTVVINNRGCIEKGYISDEDTYSEDIDASVKRERATGLPAWGYNSTLDIKESTYPSLGAKIFDIVRTMSRGYNYLLNIGPDGHGEVPPLTVKWLKNLAKFTHEYFTFNNCKGLFWQCNPEWGRIINKGNVLYLMIDKSFSEIYLDSIYTPDLKSVHIYGVEDSTMNFSIEDEYRLKIKNLTPVQSYGYSFVKMEFYNEVSALDYICTDSVIKPMQFVRRAYSGWKYSGATKDSYIMNEGSNAISCRFKWIGDTGNYKIKLNAELTNAQEFSLSITDIGGKIFASKDICKNNDSEILETTNRVELQNGSIYSIYLERTTSDATSVISNLQFTK